MHALQTAICLTLARGQDAGGIWGHRMATRKRNGRLPGYAQVNQPSLTCFMGMLLARKCGVDDPVLCLYGEPAQEYYWDMVKLAAEDKPGDPFGDIDWSVGASMNKTCADPFKAGLVNDKALHYKVAFKLAANKRQHVRADGLRMLAGMPLEDFHLVADKVMHVIRDKDPTYHSYHSPGGPIGAGITILANHGVKEGIQHTLDVLDTDSGKWRFKVRMVASVLPKYGGNAKAALEKLKADPRLKNIESGKFGGPWKAMVKAIEEDENPAKLRSFEEARRAGLK